MNQRPVPPWPVARHGLATALLAAALLCGNQPALLAAPQPTALSQLSPPPAPPPLPVEPVGAAGSQPVVGGVVGPVVGAVVEPVIDPGVQRLLATAADACRGTLARRYATSPPRVQAWLVPGLTIAIEAGERSLASLRRDGLAFGWMVLGKPDPLPIGVCRTDGAGAVRAIEVQPD
jgi:hypothetical protein